MKVSQLSSVSGDGAVVLSEALKHSQFLRLAEFREDSTDFTDYPDATTAEPGFRPIAGAYDQQDENPEPKHGQLKFLGEDVILEKSYLIDAQKGAKNLDLYKKSRLMTLAKKFANKFDVFGFSGDGTGNNVAGYETIVDGATNVDPFGDTLTINADAVSLDLSTEAGQDEYLELLDQALYEVPGANMLAGSRAYAAKMTAIARRKHALNWSKDEFGMPVARYNEIPIVALYDGSISNTQANGNASASDTTAHYIMRQEEYNGTCLVSNAGFMFEDFPELEVKPGQKARMELYFNLIVSASDSLRKIRYLKLK